MFSLVDSTYLYILKKFYSSKATSSFFFWRFSLISKANFFLVTRYLRYARSAKTRRKQEYTSLLCFHFIALNAVVTWRVEFGNLRYHRSHFFCPHDFLLMLEFLLCATWLSPRAEIEIYLVSSWEWVVFDGAWSSLKRVFFSFSPTATRTTSFRSLFFFLGKLYTYFSRETRVP